MQDQYNLFIYSQADLKYVPSKEYPHLWIS